MKNLNKNFKLNYYAPWKIILTLLLILGLTAGAGAQDKQSPVSDKEQALVIDSLVVMLNREYVFPEKAKEM